MRLKVRGELTVLNTVPPINVRCPACRHMGAFHGVGSHDASWRETGRNGQGGLRETATGRVGVRICPNPQCRSVIFFALGTGDNTGQLIFPPEVIDFDATNLPASILSSLEEAIKCHAAGCYRAAALMVRRTLEELCDDKQAKGNDLKARLAALHGVAVVPAELMSAADELRILGNDAAHIEAKDYDQIGKEESEIAIELAKELLKAVYQYTSLVARLTALKKPKVSP